MATETEDTAPTKPAENKCEEADEPGSPTDKEKQLSRKSKSNITLFFHATGNTPILKKRKMIVEATRKIAYVSSFLRRYLRLTAAESLFLYINQAFSPSLDQTIENLFECFGTDGVLNVHYSTSQAWG
ncbi:hypothetical protein V9T40_009718 [Parthenolecanium corni]|uniref:Ubiquitin-like protein ATG12 n=1 Tax=Parthenolecanium corni TaxID=536013 RepID=A0AAN9TQX3_9HEMI